MLACSVESFGRQSGWGRWVRGGKSYACMVLGFIVQAGRFGGLRLGRRVLSPIIVGVVVAETGHWPCWAVCESLSLLNWGHRIGEIPRLWCGRRGDAESGFRGG